MSSAIKKSFTDDSDIVHSDMHQTTDLQDVGKVLIKDAFFFFNFNFVLLFNYSCVQRCILNSKFFITKE